VERMWPQIFGYSYFVLKTEQRSSINLRQSIATWPVSISVIGRLEDL
jgi:hypothetical protein